MGTKRFIWVCFLAACMSCRQGGDQLPDSYQAQAAERPAAINMHPDSSSALSADSYTYETVKGALLTTRFDSFEELKKVIELDYTTVQYASGLVNHQKKMVHIRHASNGEEVNSTLKAGISQADIARVRTGGIWDKVWLAVNSPYAVIKRKDFLRVLTLGRRRYDKFGEGDVAFYDIALTMECNISGEELIAGPAKDLTEKGYLNTFNHINGQAFMTTIFSEHFADFVADLHERYYLPPLITGEFTEYQLNDIWNGPVDNYVDVVNNEWGQELGKKLKKKYNISRDTHWTPELLTNYLNDLQQYYSWALQISFEPFRPEDELVVRFANKINRTVGNIASLKIKG